MALSKTINKQKMTFDACCFQLLLSLKCKRKLYIYTYINADENIYKLIETFNIQEK